MSRLCRCSFWWVGLVVGCVLAGWSGEVHAQANLVMKSWSADVATARGAGSPVTFTFEVSNTGNKDAGAFDVAFYYGDSTSFRTLTRFATYRVASLAAKKSTGLIKVTGPLPTVVAWGVRALHYFVDPSRVIPETSEGDNYSNAAPRYARRLTITGLPDIQVEKVTINPSTQVAGGIIQVGYRLYNAGYSRVTTYFDTYFYDSTDAAFQSSDTYLRQYQRLYSMNARTHWPSATGYSWRTFTVPSTATVGDRYVIVRSDGANRIVNEIDERNNIVAGKYSIVAAKPELSLSQFSAATTVNGYNDKRTITYNVRNTGKAASGPFDISFYYGDSSSTSNLTLLGKVTIANLDAGKTTGPKGFTITMPANSAYGTRYFHSLVDSGNKVSEVNETNNRNLRAISVRGLPNLQVTSFTATPTKQMPSGEVRVNYTVTNWNRTGTTRVYVTTTIRFYYSADKSLNGRYDPSLGEVNLTGIHVGKSVSGSFVVKLPANAVAGARYLFSYVDIYSRQREASESDNSRSTPITVERAIGDLEMSTWSAPATSDGAGKSVPLSFSVRNKGNADTTPHTVSFYYGDSASRTGLTKIGDATVPTLKAGQTHKGTLSVTLPNHVLLGTRYLHYTIDSKAEVIEFSESNNVGSRAITITGKPNLQVETLSVTPLQQTPGGDVQVTYRIINKGLSKANVTTTSTIYVSPDSKLTTSDLPLQTISVPTLLAGETYPKTQAGVATVTLPKSLFPGKAFVGMIADVQSKLDESSETDNAKAVEVAIVGNVADLTMGSWSLKPTSVVGVGDNVQITFTLKNTGKSDAGAFSVAFFYGDDKATQSLRLLGQSQVAGLKAGATSSATTVTYTLPKDVLSGTRYIHAHIDSSNQVGEFTENNNKAHLPFTVTGKPNLKVDTFAVSPTQQVPGGKVTVSYRVTNDGKARMGNAVRMGFYLSTDATIDSKDTLLSSVSLNPLNSGDSDPVSGLKTITLTLPSTLQTGSSTYIGIWIDDESKLVETSETDNSQTTVVNVVTTISDLSMATIALNPTQTSGSKNLVTVEYKVQNTGTQDAVGFDVAFYYGDTNNPSSLVQLATDSVRRVDAQTTDSKRSLSLTLPSSVRSGERYIHYWIDYKGAINEREEGNNRGAVKLTLNGLPNLQVATFTASPLSQDQGKDIKVEYRVYNAGVTQAEPFTVQLALKQNTFTKVLWQGSLTALNSQAFNPVAGNKTLTVRLPQGLPAGTHDLTLTVDPDGKIKELLESDNTKKISFVVKAGKPDLKPVELSVTPTQQQATKTVTASYKIQNLMKTDAPSFRVGLYFSQDAQLDSKDVLMHSFRLAGLKAEQEYQGKETFTIPATVVGGKGVMFLVMNDDKLVAELDDTNNAISTALQVYVDKDKDGVYSDTDCNDNDKTVYPNAPEVCDGKDNNCNQKIDDDPRCVCKSTDPPRPCYSGGSECTKQQDGTFKCAGVCKPGQQSCVNGQWGTCVGEIKPINEACDGKDNNCDGNIDENLTRQCYSGKTGCTRFQDGFYRCDGPCRAGLQNCNNGNWGACVGDSTPTQEICDGRDNDCDGQVDNQVASSKSLERPCQSICGPGVEVCQPSGQWGSCVPVQPCENTPDGSADGGTGDGDPPEADCYLLGCPLDQICLKGQCVNDSCKGVQCQSDEFCRDGSCIKACNCLSCPKGESCVDGACKANACSSVTCSPGEVCDPGTGTCIKDSCEGITCGVGRTCKEGSCVDDPCTYVTCPQGQICQAGQCVGTNCPKESTGEEEPSQELSSETPPKETVAEDGSTSTLEEPSIFKDDQTNSEGTSVVDVTNNPDTNINTELPPPPGGCGCQAKGVPALSWFFGVFFVLLLCRRRRRVS